MLKKMQSQIDSLEYICKTINEEKLNQLFIECLETQKQGSSVIASGLGKNVPICEKFVGTMNSLGMKSSFLHTNSALHGDLGIIKNGDLVLILTKSGETQESRALAEHLKRRKVKVWLLTYNNDNSMIENVHDYIAMSIPDEGDLWNLVPNNSSLGYLLLLQALAMKLCEELNISIEVFRENHPGGDIGRRLATNEY